MRLTTASQDGRQRYGPNRGHKYVQCAKESNVTFKGKEDHSKLRSRHVAAMSSSQENNCANHSLV